MSPSADRFLAFAAPSPDLSYLDAISRIDASALPVQPGIAKLNPAYSGVGRTPRPAMFYGGASKKEG